MLAFSALISPVPLLYVQSKTVGFCTSSVCGMSCRDDVCILQSAEQDEGYVMSRARCSKATI